jgi:hypothetical protein
MGDVVLPEGPILLECNDGDDVCIMRNQIRWLSWDNKQLTNLIIQVNNNLNDGLITSHNRTLGAIHKDVNSMIDHTNSLINTMFGEVYNLTEKVANDTNYIDSVIASTGSRLEADHDTINNSIQALGDSIDRSGGNIGDQILELNASLTSDIESGMARTQDIIQYTSNDITDNIQDSIDEQSRDINNNILSRTADTNSRMEMLNNVVITQMSAGNNQLKNNLESYNNNIIEYTKEVQETSVSLSEGVIIGVNLAADKLIEFLHPILNIDVESIRTRRVNNYVGEELGDRDLLDMVGKRS